MKIKETISGERWNRDFDIAIKMATMLYDQEDELNTGDVLLVLGALQHSLISTFGFKRKDYIKTINQVIKKLESGTHE